MKNIFLILPIIILSCTNRGKSIDSKSFIVNNTNQSIDIVFYDDGKQKQTANGSINLSPNSVTEIENVIEGSAPFTANIMFFDSLEIIFGKSTKSVHYIEVQGTNPKAIKIDNPRNFSVSALSWQKKVTEDTRKKFSVEYTYTFTEQDYLDTKKNP